MKLTYHGHSVVAIELNDGQKLLFDPFITGNPVTDLKADEVKADWLLITHGHDDHVGDMVSIAKRNDATIISIVEIAKFAQKEGVTKTHGMNIGGKYDFPFGRVKMVHAQHSSGYEKDGEMIYMGDPAGFILQAEGKPFITPATPQTLAIWPYLAKPSILMWPFCQSATTLRWDRWKQPVRPNVSKLSRLCPFTTTPSH